MTYIENIFLCLALPMLLSLLFTSGSPRRFTLFVVLGMATCLLSAYVSSFFMGRHQCSAVTTAIENRTCLRGDPEAAASAALLFDL